MMYSKFVTAQKPWDSIAFVTAASEALYSCQNRYLVDAKHVLC